VGPDFVRGVRRRLDQALHEVGREPEAVPLSLMAGIAIGRDEAEVELRVRRLMERARREGEPREFLASVGEGFLAGTVEQVAELLHEFESAGVSRVFLQHLLHDDLDTVALIGEELAPALR
jgi:alkanesulfonate monooxygenase SsuD/methylene tetrahydromethanopterin reductase-like flavin-dependent oxidoreductase (luciferase family)